MGASLSVDFLCRSFGASFKSYALVTKVSTLSDCMTPFWKL